MILQHVIFPSTTDEPKELYFRDKKIFKNIDNILDELDVISFDTYFNSFSLEKWIEYTDIREFEIYLKAEGAFTVNVFYIKNTGEAALVEKNDYIFNKPTDIYIKINTDICASVVFFEIEKESSFKLSAASYISKTAHPKHIKISAVFCTCKREKFIKKNVDKFIELRNKYKEFNEIFKVYIIDNGNTLSKSDFDETGIELYPNINTGGSGGFARGMIEVLNSCDDTTHILLMDDDVEINIESMFRLVTLASCANIEYENSIIGGSMFDLFEKNIQYAHTDLFDYGFFNIKSYLNNIDMNNFKNTIKNSLVTDYKHQFQAWWFCCVPVEIIKNSKLPFPFFLKMDDIEYSLRHNIRILLLNGICVWHQPFYVKSTSLSEYYEQKSNYTFLMLNSRNKIHYIIRIYKTSKVLLRFLLTLNYNTANALCEVFSSLISGIDELKSVDKLNKRLQIIFSLNEKFVYDDNISETYKKLEHGFFSKIIFILTLNGHILPSFLFKSSGVAPATERSLMDYFLKNEMYVFNKYDHTYTTRTRSTKTFWKIIFNYIRLLTIYIIKLPKLRAELRNNFSYLTSEKFWKKYLNIG